MPSNEAPESSSTPAAEGGESVSPGEVRHLARLARLSFSEEEVEPMAGELSRLLSYAQKLGEVDTAGVEPMAPGAPAVPRRLRSDESERPLSQKEALENASDTGDGFFRVPNALE